MPSEGPNSPASGADDAGTGTVAWSGTAAVSTSDNSYATATLGIGEESHYLKATSFGFSIPSGATIDGIVVEWEQSQTMVAGANICDSKVRIIKGGTIGSTEQSMGGSWPTADTWASFGGASDKWGETWTDSDVNAITFGAAISAINNGFIASGTAQIDACRITIHYTAAASGTPMSQTRVAQTMIHPAQIYE